MKLLHISDLHLGKRLFDRERLPEQAEALDELIRLCDEEAVEVVLIAGDVFDTYVPPAEAEELFFRAVKGLAGSDRAVVIVSGNHDDGVRLVAGAPLAESVGVYLFGNRPRAHSAPLSPARAVHAVEEGDYFLVLENAQKERVYLNCLPYPNEARFREGGSEETFAERMARWIARGDEGYRGDMPHILLSHLFVAGGRTSDSERDIDLGGARAVPLSVLPKEGYIALGHLHRPQSVGNARYSGSLLQYSFDEANTQKCALLVETEGMAFKVRQVPIRAGKKLVRLECDGVNSALELLPQYENCYIELTLQLTEPLTTAETRSLRECAEGLVSIIPRVREQAAAPILRRSSLSRSELFDEYYRSAYGEPPKEELKAAFLALMEEA